MKIHLIPMLRILERLVQISAYLLKTNGLILNRLHNENE